MSVMKNCEKFLFAPFSSPTYSIVVRIILQFKQSCIVCVCVLLFYCDLKEARFFSRIIFVTIAATAAAIVISPQNDGQNNLPDSLFFIIIYKCFIAHSLSRWLV